MKLKWENYTKEDREALLYVLHSEWFSPQRYKNYRVEMLTFMELETLLKLFESYWFVYAFESHLPQYQLRQKMLKQLEEANAELQKREGKTDLAGSSCQLV